MIALCWFATAFDPLRFLPNPESNWGPKRAAAGWPGGKCKKVKTHHEGEETPSSAEEATGQKAQ